jgi:hypothetical protein
MILTDKITTKITTKKKKKACSKSGQKVITLYLNYLIN